MLRFKAFRRVVRQKMAVAMAPLALAGIVLGAGALTPPSAHAYVASTGCENYPIKAGADPAMVHLSQNYPVSDVSSAGPALAASSCAVQVGSLTPFRVRWAKAIKTVIRRAAPAQTVTPKPVTPTPVSPPAGGSSVTAMIEQVFGSYAAGALNVARCESGLNPDAYNPTSIGGSHAAGVFQILYPSTWDTTPEAGSSPYNAMANILAAHDIFVRDGYNWHEWTCLP